MKNNYSLKNTCKPRLRYNRTIISSISLTLNGTKVIVYVGKDPNFDLVCELYIKRSVANIKEYPWYNCISDILPEQHGRKYFNYCYTHFSKSEISRAFDTMGKVVGRLIEYTFRLEENH